MAEYCRLKKRGMEMEVLHPVEVLNRSLGA